MDAQVYSNQYVGKKLRTLCRGAQISFVVFLVLTVPSLLVMLPMVLNPGQISDSFSDLLLLSLSLFLAFALVAILALMVGFAFAWSGLRGLRKVNVFYGRAFWLWLTSLIPTVFSTLLERFLPNLASSPLVSLALTCLSTILILFLCWNFLEGTRLFLEALHREDLIALGKKLWILAILNAVISLLPSNAASTAMTNVLDASLNTGAVSAPSMLMFFGLLLLILLASVSLYLTIRYLKLASDAISAAPDRSRQIGDSSASET